MLRKKEAVERTSEKTGGKRGKEDTGVGTNNGIAMPLDEVRDARSKVRVCPQSLLYPAIPLYWTSTT